VSPFAVSPRIGGRSVEERGRRFAVSHDLTDGLYVHPSPQETRADRVANPVGHGVAFW
jgi:hypothetical protein